MAATPPWPAGVGPIASQAASVTLRAVAERAGVSAMTVSNVVNGTGRVSASTLAAVQAAISELGYVPNVAARRLAKAHATTIGLMYNEERTPFLDAILVGALRATNARGLQLILHAGDVMTVEEAAAAARALRRGGADALLLIPPFAELMSGSGTLAALGIPAAAIATGGAMPDMSTVRIDNHGAMRDLTALVIAHGHHRIGFVRGPTSNSDADERLRGFHAGLRDAGLAPDATLIADGRFDYSSGAEAIEQLLQLDPPPTAVICSNDEMAAGAAAAALRAGLTLPADLTITGFDDTLLAARMWPPLTVVRQPIEHMAYSAVELLVTILAAEQPPPPRDQVIEHVLVQRESLTHA